MEIQSVTESDCPCCSFPRCCGRRRPFDGRRVSEPGSFRQADRRGAAACLGRAPCPRPSALPRPLHPRRGPERAPSAAPPGKGRPSQEGQGASRRAGAGGPCRIQASHESPLPPRQGTSLRPTGILATAIRCRRVDVRGGARRELRTIDRGRLSPATRNRLHPRPRIAAAAGTGLRFSTGTGTHSPAVTLSQTQTDASSGTRTGTCACARTRAGTRTGARTRACARTGTRTGART